MLTPWLLLKPQGLFKKQFYQQHHHSKGLCNEVILTRKKAERGIDAPKKIVIMLDSITSQEIQKNEWKLFRTEIELFMIDIDFFYLYKNGQYGQYGQIRSMFFKSLKIFQVYSSMFKFIQLSPNAFNRVQIWSTICIYRHVQLFDFIWTYAFKFVQMCSILASNLHISVNLYVLVVIQIIIVCSSKMRFNLCFLSPTQFLRKYHHE